MRKLTRKVQFSLLLMVIIIASIFAPIPTVNAKSLPSSTSISITTPPQIAVSYPNQRTDQQARIYLYSYEWSYSFQVFDYWDSVRCQTRTCLFTHHFYVDVYREGTETVKVYTNGWLTIDCSA